MTTNQKIRWDNAAWAAQYDEQLLKQHKVSASTVRLVALAHATRGVDFDTLRVWFAVDTVATLTGISEKQVRQARKVLVELGAMVKDGYYAIPGGKGKRTERFYLDPAALEGTVMVTGPLDEGTDMVSTPSVDDTRGNGNDDRSLPRGNGNESEGTVMVTDNKNNNTSITTTDKNNKDKVGAGAPPSIQEDSFEDLDDLWDAAPQGGARKEHKAPFASTQSFEGAPAKRGDREGYDKGRETNLLNGALINKEFDYFERVKVMELVMDRNYTLAEAREFVKESVAA